MFGRGLLRNGAPFLGLHFSSVRFLRRSKKQWQSGIQEKSWAFYSTAFESG